MFIQQKFTKILLLQRIATRTTLRLLLILLLLLTMTSSTEGYSKHIMINIAMEAEANPFIEHLQLQMIDDYFPKQVPFRAYSGFYPNTENTNDDDTIPKTKVTVITNGKDSVYNTSSCNVGTISASTITMLALQKDIPDIYMNAGTAGGFQRNGANIGDIYVTSTFVFHDRRIPIPGYDIYGIGKLSSTIPYHQLANHYNWKIGICSTGNSLDKTKECDDSMLQNNVTIKDMEVAAIAWTTALYNIKFGSIKVITDIVDGTIPTQDEFLSNLQVASEKLQYALPLVLDYFSNYAHHDEL